jgi:hypothetical protein
VWIVIAAHMNCTRPTIRVVKYIWGQMLSLRGGSVVPRHKVLLDVMHNSPRLYYFW